MICRYCFIKQFKQVKSSAQVYKPQKKTWLMLKRYLSNKDELRKVCENFQLVFFFVVFELISYKRKLENKDNDKFFLVQLDLMVTSCILCYLVDHKKQKQPLEVLLGKVVLKICSKFTGEHPC